MVVRTCAVAVLGAVSLIAVSSGPATADRLSVADGAGDVWRWEPTSYAPEDEPAGTQVDADVTRTTVNHLRRQVRVSVRYADLEPTDGAWQFEVVLRTDTDAQYDVVLTATAADPAGSTSMWEEGDASFACSAVRHSVDYDTDLMTLAIPRRCLGRPSSVRFAGRAGASHWPTPGTEVDYSDDARSARARPEGRWSAAIHRQGLPASG